jgi:hypothetical protein
MVGKSIRRRSLFDHCRRQNSAKRTENFRRKFGHPVPKTDQHSPPRTRSQVRRTVAKKIAVRKCRGVQRPGRRRYRLSHRGLQARYPHFFQAIPGDDSLLDSFARSRAVLANINRSGDLHSFRKRPVISLKCWCGFRGSPCVTQSHFVWFTCSRPARHVFGDWPTRPGPNPEPRTLIPPHIQTAECGRRTQNSVRGQISTGRRSLFSHEGSRRESCTNVEHV